MPALTSRNGLPLATASARRVPKRHDPVGHVFVDRAVMRHDDVGHRRQIAVEKARQLAGVEAFRDRRKAADVAEHDRQLAQLAA
jgi:uncharacterized protein with von Willebrand factor type A (vWA) domain